MRRKRMAILGGFGLAAVLLISANALAANPLEDLSLERMENLREAERYQFNIAQKYYGDRQWDVAAEEYRKYLTLYERSDAAPYMLLKWALCQRHLRQANTSIRDGFQSVVDYWPDSPDAIVAAYLIGETYKDMGETQKAKKAYQEVLKKHPQHFCAAYSMRDLAAIADTEQDTKTKVAMWEKLTFEVKREQGVGGICQNASQSLAAHLFYQGAFDDAVKALATTYSETELPYYVLHYARGPINSLTQPSETKAQGEKLADQAIKFILDQAPSDLTVPENKQRARQYWLYTAEVHAAAGRPEQVPKVYEQMKQKFGTDDDLLERLAGWYISQNRLDEARAVYRQFEDKIKGRGLIAASYRKRNVDAAVTAYRQLAGDDADRRVHWTGEAAASYREVGKYNEAIGVYEELIALDSEHANDWRWNIATAHHEAHQWKEAIAHYRQVDKFPSTHFNMGECNRALKQFGEALTLYREIIGSSPGDAPRAAFLVAETLEQAGEKEKAIKAYQTVCKNYPKDGYASRAHAHLQNEYKISVTLGGGTKGN